jgi:hypothetical protein
MDLTTDFLDALYIEKVLAARERTFEEKFSAGGVLFEDTIERMRMGILMDQPDATEEQVMRELRRRLAISRRLEGRT